MSEHKKPGTGTEAKHPAEPDFSGGGDKADFDGGDGTDPSKSGGADKPDFGGGDGPKHK
jgi:hypothetical protein